MKKIFILAYLRKNLGDDLFVTILLEKYKNSEIQFYINIDDEKFISDFSNYNNLTILNDKNNFFDEELKYDAYVYIAGSIFMENTSLRFVKELKVYLKKCNINKKPFYFISTNFGPCYTTEFYNDVYETLEKSTSICFRDKYSYESFKSLKSVSYAPDAVLSMGEKNNSILKNTVGINVILPKKSDKLMEEKVYYNVLKNNIENYILNGNMVYLFSFCDKEGDNLAIQKLITLIDNRYLSKIAIIKYDGNMNKFTDIYSRMEYMLCSRFHGMILSCLYGSKINVLSYSEKINNVINDLNLKLNYINFNDLTDYTEFDLNEYAFPRNTSLKKAIKDANKQFAELDKFVKGNNEVKGSVLENIKNIINNMIIDETVEGEKI